MGLLFFVGVLFFFLMCGAIVFHAFLLQRNVRRYALSAALWCAVWGPCTIGFAILAGLSLVAADFVPKAAGSVHLDAPKLLAKFGWSYLVVGVLSTMVLATTIAWLHQSLIDRLPFILFRIYASLVVAGIGSVFGWCVSFWRAASGAHGTLSYVAWIFLMLGLIAGFGSGAYKGASGLRNASLAR